MLQTRHSSFGRITETIRYEVIKFLKKGSSNKGRCKLPRGRKKRASVLWVVVISTTWTKVIDTTK